MAHETQLLPVFVRLYEQGQERVLPVGQAYVSETEIVLSLEPIVLKRPDADALEPGTERLPGGRIADLERLAQRSRKVLSDPRKERWHGDVRAQLAEIEAELARLKERGPG